MKDKNVFELEELAMEGNAEAAKELVRRYSTGDGVAVDLDAASTWEAYLESNKSEEPFIIEDNPKNEESENIEETIMKQEKDIDLSVEKYQQIESFRLRKMSVAGDAVAKIVLGERYIEASTEVERDEGAGLLAEGIEVLKNMLIQDSDSSGDITRLLVRGNRILGEYYWLQHARMNLKRYGETRDDTYAERVFECFSNIYELTDEITDELIKCYQEGIGVEKNEEYANELQVKRAEKGDVEERVQYADMCLSKGQTMKAKEWYQAALAANDAESHPAICCYAKIRMLKNDDKNDNEEQLSMKRNELCKLADSGNDEAIKYLSKLNYEEAAKEYQNVEQSSPTEKDSVSPKILAKHKKAIIAMVGIIMVCAIVLIVYACTRPIDVTVGNEGADAYMIRWSEKKNNYIVEKTSEKKLCFKSEDEITDEAKRYIESQTEIQVMVNDKKAKSGDVVKRGDKVIEVPEYIHISPNAEENVRKKYNIDITFKSDRVDFPKKYVSAKEVLKDKQGFFSKIDSKAEIENSERNEFYSYYRGLLKSKDGSSDCLVLGYAYSGILGGYYLDYKLIDDFDSRTSIGDIPKDFMEFYSMDDGMKNITSIKELKKAVIEEKGENYKLIDLAMWDYKKKKAVDIY